MSKSKTTGIDVRHGRGCPAKTGGRCSCKPTFQANVWDAGGQRRIRKTFSNQTAARQWREDAKSQLRTGEMTGAQSPLLSVAVEAWLDNLRAGDIRNRSGERYKPAAIRDYERNMRLRVLPALGKLRVQEITTHDVQRFTDRLVADGLASATISASITPLAAFYRRAVSRGEARINPVSRVEKPAIRCAPRKVVTPAQAEAMLTALVPRDRALWATAFFCGLRRGELIGLTWEDVDLASGVIHVRRGWDAVEGEIEPKSRKGHRKVPIPAVPRDQLDQHKLMSNMDERVFRSAVSVRRLVERAHRAWREQDLPVIALHEARHTYATFAITAGLNAKSLSTYMGHANIAVTMDLYGHLLPGNEDEAVSLLDAFFSSTGAQTVAHPQELAC